MKNLLMAGFLGFCLLNLTGCMGVASPVAGWAYTEAKFDNQVTDGPAPTKTGTACATSILAMVATGDASLEKAMANGGITQITTLIIPQKISLESGVSTVLSCMDRNRLVN